MRGVKFFWILLVAVMSASAACAQYAGSVYSFALVNASQVNVVQGTTSTTIKFSVGVQRFVGKPFRMNFKLGIASNGENFQTVYTIQDGDFVSGQMSLIKEFTATIANTKLVHQKRIALYSSLPNPGPEFYSEYLSYNYIINNPPPGPAEPNYHITISSVDKVSTEMFGTDCGFNHAHAMEKGVWKFAYQVAYSVNESLSPDDIYWEWIVEDNSQYFPGEKQFIIYPFGASVNVPLTGQNKVFIEANDLLDTYDSAVKVRAKLRHNSKVISDYFTFFVNGVSH